MRLQAIVPGDEVIDFLKDHGATKTDADPSFPSGRYFERINEYVRLIEEGDWWNTRKPIILNAKTGTVWQGTDRSMALSMVDWSKVQTIPMFHILVENAERASGHAPA